MTTACDRHLKCEKNLLGQIILFEFFFDEQLLVHPCLK
jgi:hypothetical protein